MKILLMNQDITPLVTTWTWSGDYQQVARTLAFNIAVSPTDPNLPVLSMSMGNMVKLFDDDGNELFRGYLFSRDKSNSNNEMTVTAYDALIYLTKSKGTYNFKNMTAEAVTAKVAVDFNIPVGDLATTGISQSFIADGQAIYDIIMQAYSGAAVQNGKVYMPLMDAGLLNIIEKGSMVSTYELSDTVNVSDSEYTESIEDVINRVKIYDAKENYVGMVQNSDWVNSYGILQDVYKVQDGIDSNTAAIAMLKAIERTSTITALGNTSCVTGMAVFVDEPFTGLSGLFYINTDQHTWQNGQYTMQLTVDLQDVMDSKAKKLFTDTAKANKKASTSSKKSSTSLLSILEAGGYTQ